MERDAFNEDRSDDLDLEKQKAGPIRKCSRCVIRTTLGDMEFKLFPEKTPKTYLFMDKANPLLILRMKTLLFTAQTDIMTIYFSTESFLDSWCRQVTQQVLYSVLYRYWERRSINMG